MSTTDAQTPTTRPLPDLDDRPVLTSTPGGAALLGHQCDACGARHFPTRAACGDCGGRHLTEVALSTGGRLYSFTTVHVSSARPTPYTLGYVDLADGVRVLAPIAGEPARLTIDAPVELTQDTDGDWSFQLAPQNGDHDA